jgi:hypothetical protein
MTGSSGSRTKAAFVMRNTREADFHGIWGQLFSGRKKKWRRTKGMTGDGAWK